MAGDNLRLWNEKVCVGELRVCCTVVTGYGGVGGDVMDKIRGWKLPVIV